jgi:hypothetical protein
MMMVLLLLLLLLSRPRSLLASAGRLERRVEGPWDVLKDSRFRDVVSLVMMTTKNTTSLWPESTHGRARD